MAVLQKVKDFIVRSFKYPKPFNWGYPIFFGACGLAAACLMSKLMFAGAFPFSSTSLIGCAVIVILLVLTAFLIPSVLMAEKGGLDITGRYTGIGALILSFLSGAPLYLIKAPLLNITTAFWLKNGGSVVFPAFFYHLDEITGQSLFLSILIDTVVPAFGISLFFLGTVWQGFNEKNKRWAFIFIPLFIALFSFDFLNIPGILIISWWLCIVRSRTENIYGPVLALLGARFTGILIGSVVIELDLTTIRTYSDIPPTIYYSSLPALVMAVILLAFFRKTLGEFHNTYSESAEIFGDSRLPVEKDGGKANGILSGFNMAFMLGVLVLAIFWIMLFDGVRI